MDAETRSYIWQTVERVFADQKLPLGTAFPIAMMVAVRREDLVPEVRSELARAGLEVASVDKRWWPFGRRWHLAAKSHHAKRIDHATLDPWLENLESVLTKHDATVLTWVPTIPLEPGA